MNSISNNLGRIIEFNMENFASLAYENDDLNKRNKALDQELKLARKAIRAMTRHNKRQADLIAWLATNPTGICRPKWVVEALHKTLGTDRRQTNLAAGREL